MTRVTIRRRRALLLLALLVPLAVARADDAVDAAKAFHAKQYARAVELYRRVVEKGDRSPMALYNLGTALLAADSLKSAGEALERAASDNKDAELRYRALFNLGLSHLRAGLRDSGQAAEPELDAALAAYKKVLLARSDDVDAKWNYELALRAKQQGGGGGGGGGQGEQNPSPKPDPSAPQQAPQQRPQGGIGERRADELLNSAAREERDVQGKKQQQNRPEPPPGGKDW
jgi:Ca-activated chloride channel family protein